MTCWKIICLFSVWCACSSAARTWTDVQGRKTDGELVRVDGEKAIVRIQGKEVPISISLLSVVDQTFLEEWKTKAASNVGATQKYSLCGNVLEADGKLKIVRVQLITGRMKRLKLFSDDDLELVIGVALPPGFDPKRSQNVLWVGIDTGLTYTNNVPRVEGASAVFLEKAIGAGFVVVIADCLKSKMETNWSDTIITTINEEAVDIMEKEWPGFRSWRFVCAGVKGGGRVAGSSCVYMIRNKVNAVGVIHFASSSGTSIEWYLQKIEAEKAEFKKLRAFVSLHHLDNITGQDPKVNVDKEKQIAAKCREVFGNVMLDYRNRDWNARQGDINQDALKMGLQWFLQ